jgi:quercetin dioxygenase-like cupin family protein
MKAVHALDGRTQIVEVFGPTLEFLTPPTEGVYCVLKGTIPPGGSVPLHSHPEPESFFVVSGKGQALIERDARLEWIDVKAGDFIHIPGNAKHAHRNTSTEPLVELATTNATLGKFFLEIGRAPSPGQALSPPTAEDLARFQRISARYGQWMASPAENAAVGLTGF